MQVSQDRAPLVRVLSERSELARPKLVIPVMLSQAAEDRNGHSPPNAYKTMALIDTGATISCVCTKVLSEINAEPWGQVNSVGIGGTRKSYYHYVDLQMQDNDHVSFATFESIKVIDFESLPQDAIGILIGMDVLGKFSEIRIQGLALEFGALLT
jgi:hypothetical protein